MMRFIFVRQDSTGVGGAVRHPPKESLRTVDLTITYKLEAHPDARIV